MKRIVFLIASAAAIAVLAAGVAAADGPRHGGRSLDFDAIDADGNGSIDRAELTTRAEGRIATADSDGDGTLSRAELIDASPRRGGLGPIFAADPAEARVERLLAEMGATEAGGVTVAELAERQTNRLLSRIDTDRNSAISREEAAAFRDRVAERMERHRGERDRF